MKSKAVQDYYPDDVAHCYGCGKLNEHGHQIKTFWEGDETVTRFYSEGISHSNSGICLRWINRFVN